ncbi:MAG: GNAT family N-acetyltransferase [Saprospiraceae bacterium]
MTILKIRKAERNDIPAIFALVKELAEYEKAPEAVITSEKIYLDDFTNAVFDAHVAELNGEIIGMALYYLAYSTWKGKMLYLEDFVVKSAHRRTGAGQLLFDAFLEEAKNRNCSMVKWQVLDWNEPAIRFYEKNNAIIESDWWNGKIFLVDPTIAL